VRNAIRIMKNLFSCQETLGVKDKIGKQAITLCMASVDRCDGACEDLHGLAASGASLDPGFRHRPKVVDCDALLDPTSARHRWRRLSA
jgi:hypothetical protein